MLRILLYYKQKSGGCPLLGACSDHFDEQSYFSMCEKNLQDIIEKMSQRNFDKAALRGEPSYVWRAGQERRLEMIVRGAGKSVQGWILGNGGGGGLYVEHLAP